MSKNEKEADLKEEGERAAEVKEARSARSGKKLQYAVVVEDEHGDSVVVSPTEYDPTNPKSWDSTKPHSVNGVPMADSEIGHLLDKVTNKTAWAQD